MSDLMIKKPKKKINSGLIVLIVIVAIALIVGIIKMIISANSTSVTGNIFTGDYIAVINIEGTIEEKNQTYDQEWLLNTITKVGNDKKNVGILLKINSPGGSVYESDEAYLALQNYSITTGRPIFAYFEALAASGGC